MQRCEAIGCRLVDPVDELLEVAAQDRDRRAKLVREVGHQQAASALLALEGVSHRVEGLGQLAQLPGGTGLLGAGG